jgi:hypothetical protein
MVLKDLEAQVSKVTEGSMKGKYLASDTLQELSVTFTDLPVL